jgi:hypothetical protein
MNGQENFEFLPYRSSLTHRLVYSRLIGKMLSFYVRNIISSVDSIGESRVFVPRCAKCQTEEYKKCRPKSRRMFLGAFVASTPKIYQRFLLH